MDTIVVRNLVKTYGAFKAVDNVSFSVKQGEIFALLGPNGAGKTTTIKIMTTLIPQTSGICIINGHDVRKEPRVVKRDIGWIASEVILDDDLQVIENLKLQADLQGVSDWYATAMRLLEYFGIKNTVKMRAGNLSTGMRKKVEITMALLGDPSVIFMDEPTLGLDVGTRSMLWDLIKKTRDEHKVTIFLTTHYMDEADQLCDRIAIISKGKIVTIGTPEKLRSKAGGGVVVLTVTGEFSMSSIRSLSYKRQGNEIKIHLRKSKDSFVSVLKKIDLFQVSALRLEKPSLDTAFIKLTGSTMAEQEEDHPIDYRKFYRQLQRARQ